MCMAMLLESGDSLAASRSMPKRTAMVGFLVEVEMRISHLVCPKRKGLKSESFPDKSAASYGAHAVAPCGLELAKGLISRWQKL